MSIQFFFIKASIQLINQLVSALRSFEFATARARGISGGHAKQTSEVKIGHGWFVNGLLFDAVWMLLYSIRLIVVLFCFVLFWIFFSSFSSIARSSDGFFLCKFGVDCLVDQVLDHQVTKFIRCDLDNLPEKWFLLWKSWLKVVHVGLATFLALIIY